MKLFKLSDDDKSLIAACFTFVFCTLFVPITLIYFYMQLSLYLKQLIFTVLVIAFVAISLIFFLYCLISTIIKDRK